MSCIAIHHPEKCRHCGACSEIVNCPGAEELICIGCGACVLTCPYQALELLEAPREREVTIEVNGKLAAVPEQISVKDALIEASYPLALSPQESGLFAPCEAGGCWSCAVEIDGVVKPACRTIVRKGMKIRTGLPEEYVPRRIILNFQGHPMGGVGTPRHSRGNNGFYLEAVCFTAGCNLRCPSCQNWPITYMGQGEALTPQEAARRLTTVRESLELSRMTVSGGESTLNRAWLTLFLKEMRGLNPDPEARFHIDTNGSLLTHDYIDELVDAGMTDIGIDLKALETDTFMRITGLSNRDLAENYRETAWKAVRYLIHNYSEKIFVGVGIPYNRAFTSPSKISRMGQKLLEIAPSLQVTVLNYRSAFRSNIVKPEDMEMMAIRDVLQDMGLKNVVVQTTAGNIGP